MKVEYAPRATRDLLEIGSYYRGVAGDIVAGNVGQRIERVINLIARQPLAAPRVSERVDVRVALVRRYPYKIFYRVRKDSVQILHVRHTSRRPWTA